MISRIYVPIIDFIRDQQQQRQLKSCGLSPALYGPIQLKYDDSPPSGSFFEAWDACENCTKWWNYFPVYQRHLSCYVGRPLLLLEIGVFQGGTIPAWRKFLGEGLNYVGIDINPECCVSEDTAANINIRIGSQSDPKFLQALTDEFGQFDVIIDDGSHRPADQITSFNYLFDEGLKPGGTYIVEDTHAESYLRFGLGQKSFTKMISKISQCINYIFTNSRPLHRFYRNHEQRFETLTVPRINTLVNFIETSESIITIRKADCKGIPVSDWR